MEQATAGRVEALIELRRSEQAAEAAREALASDPENPDLQCDLAWALIEAGDEAGGLAAAEAAVRLAPDHEFPHRRSAGSRSRAATRRRRSSISTRRWRSTPARR